MERHDPDGTYVRRHVEVGCVIGASYPMPIVDHLAARRAALERYAIDD